MQRRIRVVFSIIPFRQLGCLYYEEARNFAPPPYDGFAFVVVICTIAQRAGSGLFTGVRRKVEFSEVHGGNLARSPPPATYRDAREPTCSPEPRP
jgi:hypothetical protein